MVCVHNLYNEQVVVFLCANPDVRLVFCFTPAQYIVDITRHTQNHSEQLSWLDCLGVVTSLGQSAV